MREIRVARAGQEDMRVRGHACACGACEIHQMRTGLVTYVMGVGWYRIGYTLVAVIVGAKQRRRLSTDHVDGCSCCSEKSWF
jgi:hypothetical protein